MKKIQIPIKGLINKDDSPLETVGGLHTCENWIISKGAVKQPNGTGLLALTSACKGMVWSKNSSNIDIIGFVDGLALKTYRTSNNTTVTVNANEFNNYTGTLRTPWPFESFNQHIFIGSVNDGLHWLRWTPYTYNNNTLAYAGKCGVAAPANAGTIAAGANGALTGVYRGVYTFVNYKGHESAPSPITNNGNALSVSGKVISWSNIAAGGAGTVARKLYRTVNDGALYLYLTTINDNTTTTYNDSTLDTSLGSEVDYEGSDLPPDNIRGMCTSGARLYILDSTGKIWASKIDSQTSLPNWEAFPASLVTSVPVDQGGVYAIFTLNNLVHAAGRKTIYRLEGDPYSGAQVVRLAEIGLLNPNSWVLVYEEGKQYVYMLTSAHRLIRMDGDGVWESVNDDIIDSLKLASNPFIPVEDDSVVLTYYAPDNTLIINYSTETPAINNKAYVFDLKSKLWSGPIDWPYSFTAVDETGTRFAGYEDGFRISTLVEDEYCASVPGSSPPDPADYFTNQSFQTYPFFFADKAIRVGRLGIVCRGLPVVNYIPPMLKVAYALDNNDVWKEKLVDCSILPTRLGNDTSGQVSKEVITVYVPVHSTAKSIAVRVTSPKNEAAVQGFEIYDMFLEVDEAEEVSSSRRDIDKDKR